MMRFSGRLRSALMIGGQGIRARKLRTLLSMTSLFLGVLAVVAVQAGAETARSVALADVELTMGKDGTLQTALPPTGDILPTALEVVKGRPNVVLSVTTPATIGEPLVKPLNPGAAPIEHAGQSASFESEGGQSFFCDATGCYVDDNNGKSMQPPGQAVEVIMTAMTADMRQFQPFRAVSGQWLDFSDAPLMAPRLVLNTAAAKFFSEYSVPAELQVEGATANSTPRIVGVVDDGGERPTVYVRMDEIQNWMPPAGESTSSHELQLQLAPEAADVLAILKARLLADDLEFAQHLSAEPIQSRKSIEEQLSLMRWIFLGMASLVLLIGVAGILNVGLATVGERVEEFALRRAVGTPRILLAGIVLAENLLTGLFTAAAATGVAMLSLQVAADSLRSIHPSMDGIVFPWQAGAAGIIAGLAAGILGGLIPALRAARIPISIVMRA